MAALSRGETRRNVKPVRTRSAPPMWFIGRRFPIRTRRHAAAPDASFSPAARRRLASGRRRRVLKAAPDAVHLGAAGGEGGKDARVEMPRWIYAAVAFENAAARFLVGEARLVGAWRAERVVDIGDGDDACRERNCLAAQAGRIAGPIPFLVMATGDIGRHGEPRRGAKDFVAIGRMAAHLAPLRR